jgi:urease accessory protein
MVTQGHTKIFKSPSRDVLTRQTLNVTIQNGASLCLLPDPVQPFEESVYRQSQLFHIADDGSICLLDWVSAGRTARGEDWDFWSWRGRNEVWATKEQGGKPRLLLRDNVILESQSLDPKESTIKSKMNGLDIFGTLILRGPNVESVAAFFLAEFAAMPRIGARDFRSQDMKDTDSAIVLSHLESWRSSRLKKDMSDGILWSAAKVRGCTVVKFGARTVEGARVWIGGMLKEEGSIPKVFGEDAMMCVR